MVAHCQLDNNEQNKVKFEVKYSNLNLIKCIQECRLENGIFQAQYVIILDTTAYKVGPGKGHKFRLFIIYYIRLIIRQVLYILWIF